MSLYRSYRPTTLADVIGQDHVVTTIEQSLKQDRLAHAYLFAGPRGTGKTSVARILARAMLTKGVTDDLVVSQILKGVDDGNLVDLVEIDAASNRRIDDVRSLLENIQFPPVAAGAKVYIVDEVHMLTKEAFNALLKTLEEPPPYAYFILATTELHKIPATIQSRCQRFQFRQIREEDIVRRLQFVSDQERIVADRTALRAIAHHAHGGMRDALAILDQLRSLEKIEPGDVSERIGETGHDQADAIFAALASGDRKSLLALTEQLEQLAVPVENVIRLMLEKLRSEVQAAAAGNQPIDPAKVGMIDALLQCLKDLRTSPVPSVVLDTALLKMSGIVVPSAAPAPAPVAARAAPPPPAPAPAPVPARRPAPVAELSAEPEAPAPAATTIEAPALSLQEIARVWPEVLQAVAVPSVRMSLKNGRLNELANQTLTISFSSAFHKDKVAALEASRNIEEILHGIFKSPVRIKCVVDSEGVATAHRDVVDVAEMAAEIF